MTASRITKFWPLGLVIGALALAAYIVLGKVDISHGPLVGGVRPNSVGIWLRTDQSADVFVEHSADAAFGNPVRTPAKRTDSASDYTAKFLIGNLPPGRPRYYRLYLDGALQPGVRRFDTAPLLSTAPLSFSVLSDFRKIFGLPALAAVDKLNPDLLVFLGDLDHRNPGHPKNADTAADALRNMRVMHRELRGTDTALGTDFQSVVVDRRGRQFPFIYAWDDHDFGINNSDRTFRFRAEALKAFDEYFVKAGREGADPARGIWQLQSYGAADLFILDLRSERDPNGAPNGPAKTMLGPEQKNWLKSNLLASKRKWKFILSSVPFNPGTKPYDAWGSFPNERQELVDFIRSNGITGVIIVSGDIHTGGAIDDGTNSGFPEISVPHANLLNFYDTFKGQPGVWSEGLLSGSVGSGFAHFEVSQAQVVMTVRGAGGEVRKTYTVR